jgi:hypothetical protein
MSIRNILDTAQYIIKVKDIQIDNEGSENYVPSLFNGFMELSYRVAALEIANPSGWYGDFVVDYTLNNWTKGEQLASLIVSFFDYDDDEVQLANGNDMDLSNNPFTFNIDISNRVIGYSYNLFINNIFGNANTLTLSASFNDPEIIYNGTEIISGVEYKKYFIPLNLYGSQITYQIIGDAQQGYGGNVIVNWSGTASVGASVSFDCGYEDSTNNYVSVAQLANFTPIGSTTTVGDLQITPPLPFNKDLLIDVVLSAAKDNITSFVCTNASVISNGQISLPSYPSLYSFTVPPSLNSSNLTFNLITSTT